jgi:stearoyl-CoA desaturase (delta-9 desaturase)
MSQASNPNQGRPIWLHIFFLTLTPLASVILVPWWVMTYGVTREEIIAMIVLWLITGMGVTVGYHRLFSHASFRTPAPLRFLAVLFGGAAWQGSAIRWCSGHRHHHSKVDTDEDPYNVKRGFWWSHMGWVMFENPRGEVFDNVPDLKKDPILAFQHRWYMLLSVGFNVGVPVLLGLWLNDVGGMLLFAGLVRVVLVHHFTFLINSLAHIVGKQPWSDANTSKDNWFLSFLTFGEGYHNYHHAFAGDYRNGTKYYNVDPSKWLIWSLSKIGLASDLRRVGADVILRRRFEESLGRVQNHQEKKETPIELQTLCDDFILAWTEFKDEWATVLRTSSKAQKKALKASRRRVTGILKEWELAVQEFTSRSKLSYGDAS